MPTEPHRQELGVVDYYEILGPVMQELWDDNFHFGYWDDPDDTSTVAVVTDRFTDLVIDRLGAGDGARVLDLGCGVGKPAVRLARAAEVEIVGITVSRDQVEQANDRARQERLAERVRFEVADGTDMPFADDSFDAVMAFESIQHMDRDEVLRDVGRVLRPGGRLVATDLVERADTDRTTSSANATFSPLPSLARYPDLLAGNGLEAIELLDVTANTMHVSMRRIMRVMSESEAALAAMVSPSQMEAVAAANRSFGAATDLGCVLVVATATSTGGPRHRGR